MTGGGTGPVSEPFTFTLVPTKDLSEVEDTD